MKSGSSKFFVEGAALRATTNPGATKDRRCRSGGDLPPPGLRLPPSRDALRRASRLADGGASPPPIRAPSPRRDTNAAFAAHESTRNPHPRRVPEKHVVAVMGHVDYGRIFAMNQTMIYPDECYAIRGAIYEVYRELGNGFREEVYQQCLEREFASRGIPFDAQCPCRTFREVSWSRVAQLHLNFPIIVNMQLLGFRQH